MKSNVAFHPLVEWDATDAAEWYERQRAGLGVHFVSEYGERLKDLPSTALLYAVWFHDIRRANLPTYPYGVFYFILDDQVIVLGILHGARDTEAELKRRRERYA